MFFRLLRINPDGRTRFVRFRKEASIHSGSETVNAGGVYGSPIPFFLFLLGVGPSPSRHAARIATNESNFRQRFLIHG